MTSAGICVYMNEKEFAVIKEIAYNHQPSQRLIARRVGISLGLTNLIIKRLVKKGYLKVSQLNPRKVSYILTPKGFAEKTKKSYYYTLRTIKTLKNLQNRIQKIILSEYRKGKHEFIVQGNSELSRLVEISLRDLKLEDLEYGNEDDNGLLKESNYTILNTEEGMSKASNQNEINIVQRLAEMGGE